jgi:PiT family inorganic phosphate transporter
MSAFIIANLLFSTGNMVGEFHAPLWVIITCYGTITGAIMGVEMARRLSAVRWGVAGNIILAWILTIPATLIISGLICPIMKITII